MGDVGFGFDGFEVSTHSRLKAAGLGVAYGRSDTGKFQHTAA